MKVKELIEKLNKFDKEKEVIIRFAVCSEDEKGYVLIPEQIDLFFNDQVAIYAEYYDKKEDCDFIGQVYLKEAYLKFKDIIK